MGPATANTPSIGANTPNAFCNAGFGKVAVMIAMPCGMRKAPKTPCATRAPISISGDSARPAAAGAATKPAIPMRKVPRCPNLSPMRPPSTRSEPSARA